MIFIYNFICHLHFPMITYFIHLPIYKICIHILLIFFIHSHSFIKMQILWWSTSISNTSHLCFSDTQLLPSMQMKRRLLFFPQSYELYEGKKYAIKGHEGWGFLCKSPLKMRACKSWATLYTNNGRRKNAHPLMHTLFIQAVKPIKIYVRAQIKRRFSPSCWCVRARYQSVCVIFSAYPINNSLTAVFPNLTAVTRARLMPTVYKLWLPMADRMAIRGATHRRPIMGRRRWQLIICMPIAIKKCCCCGGLVAERVMHRQRSYYLRLNKYFPNKQSERLQIMWFWHRWQRCNWQTVTFWIRADSRGCDARAWANSDTKCWFA